MNFGIASDHIGVCPQCQNAESEANKMGKKLPYIESELENRKWDISVHRKELDEHKKLLDERLWDINVHRKELNERLWDISVHRKELDEHKKLLDERLWDINVHRKELVENKKLFNQIIQEQNKIDKRINKIEGIWFIRVWRKIAQIWHKNS